jgi:hypothetical protein
MLPIWGRIVDFVARLRHPPQPQDHEEAERRIERRDEELREAVAGRLEAQSKRVTSKDQRRVLLQTRRKVLDGGETALLLAMGVMGAVGDEDGSDGDRGEKGN